MLHTAVTARPTETETEIARAEFARLCDLSDAKREALRLRVVEVINRLGTEANRRCGEPRNGWSMESNFGRVLVVFGATSVKLEILVAEHSVAQVRAEAPATIICRVRNSSMGDMSESDAETMGRALQDAASLSRTVRALLA